MRGQKKITIIIAMLLLTTTPLGYLFLAQRDQATPALPQTLETITTTDDTQIYTKDLISAGPLEGYSPLTVSFYGNPDNDTCITSYHWDFGPQGAGIIQSDIYTQLTQRPIRLQRLISIIAIASGIGIGTASPPLAFGAIAACMIALLLVSVKMEAQTRLHYSFQSDDRGTSMVFLYPGSYSATLTVTDAQGHTAQDTVWVMALKYPPNPPPDYDTHYLLHQISRRT